MKRFPVIALILLAAQIGHNAAAQSNKPDPGFVDEGRYLATAGDCAGCHGKSLAGGAPVESPAGIVYATNITPDVKTGIGSFTLKQFSDVMRKGEAPYGHLYPAMPYTSYTGLSDDQIRALYSYLMLGVQPVQNAVPETKLPFPFVRFAMVFWNALFLDEGQPTGAIAVQGELQKRGRLLVETLGHCGACHTPRGELMQERPDRHLAGAMVGGWWAPNITSDQSGIGGWKNDELSKFLITGHTDIAVAGGEMGIVVSRSLSTLKRDDINAIIAYLRAIPPVKSQEPARSARRDADNVLRIASIEPAIKTNWQQLLGYDTAQGDILYQSACASCHGVDGKGSLNFEHPSLRRIASVTGPQGATLVQVIAHGVDRKVGKAHALMPAFRESLSNAQIASLANYVRTEFGGVESQMNAPQVRSILDGSIDTPWLVQNAQWLAVVTLVFIALLLIAIAWAIIRVTRGSEVHTP